MADIEEVSQNGTTKEVESLGSKEKIVSVKELSKEPTEKRKADDVKVESNGDSTNESKRIKTGDSDVKSTDESTKTEDTKMETVETDDKDDVKIEKVVDDDKKEANSNNDASTNKDVKDEGEKVETADKEEIVIDEAFNKKVVTQVEYYFGDFNLPRDKFLKDELSKNDGWVEMATMTKFKRLACLTTDHEIIITALKEHGTGLMEIDEENKKIRRSPKKPLPIFSDELRAETLKRTVYVKGFPKDGRVCLDTLLEFFKPYGPYETILMRHYYDKITTAQGFKGSVLVVFPTEEGAKTFLESGDVQYKKQLLIKKWHEKYLAEKKAEIDERKARKEARKKEREEEAVDDAVPDKFEALPTGTFLHISGLQVNHTREAIKEAINKYTDGLAFIDYNKGNTEGYLRFSEGGDNEKILEKIGTTIKITESEATLRIVKDEEEEEQLKKANEARSKAMSMSSRNRRHGGGGGGGRGRGRGGGRGRFNNKRKRH